MPVKSTLKYLARGLWFTQSRHLPMPTRRPIYMSMYGQVYICEHPVYSRCTLYKINEKGLAVIQQRFNSATKTTWWSEIDPWLTDELYLQKGFTDYFEKRCGGCTNGLYPTVSVRQIMWALKMKPQPKERWETVFDRADI